MATEQTPQLGDHIAVAPDLDPTIVNLARAIRANEGGVGGYDKATGKDGEHGAFSITPAKWKDIATKFLGDSNAEMTPLAQNQGVYKQLKAWKDQGYNIAQIASLWNSGNPDPNRLTPGTSAGGAPYDVQSYVNKVADSYQQYKSDYVAANPPGSELGAGATPGIPQPSKILAAGGLSLQRDPGEVTPYFHAENNKNPLTNVIAPIANLPLEAPRALENIIKSGIEAKKLYDENKGNIQNTGNPAKDLLANSQNPNTPINLFKAGVKEVAVKPAVSFVSTLGNTFLGGLQALIKKATGVDLKDKAAETAFNGILDNTTKLVEGFQKQFEKQPLGTVEMIKQPLEKATGAKDIVTATARPVIDTTKAAINTAISKTGLPNAIVDNVANIYRETAGVAKKPTKTLNASELRGKDPAQFLAENNITPNIQEGKMFTKTPQQDAVFQRIAQPYNDALDAGLAEIEPSVPKIKLADVEAQAIANVRTPANIANNTADFLEKAVQREFKTYAKNFGDEVTLRQLNSIKKGKWGQTKFDITKPYQGDVNYNIGKAAKVLIENTVPKDAFSVHGLNDVLGDIYDARKFFQSLDGYTVKGGRLGKYFARTIGAGIGAGIPIPGGEIIGALGGDAIMQILQKNTFSNPLKKMILEGLKKADPAAYTQALEFIKQSQKARSERLALPESQTIFQGGPKTPDTSGINAQESAANAERINAISRENTPKLPAGKPGTIPGKTVGLPKETQSTIDARERSTLQSKSQETNKTANIIPKTAIKESVYTKGLEVNSDNIAERIKSSEGLNVEKAIKNGDLTKEQVYQPNGKLQHDFAQGRIDDVAQKLDLLQKGMGARYKAMIDAKNTTMADIIKKGLALIKVVDKMKGKNVK